MPLINAPQTSATSFTVYRAIGSPVVINGASLSIDIKDGSLVVSNGGNPVYVFGPGHWITVNFNPATA
jgi:hypothetical protein